jgi:uncharacterized SAM-binding protein YcdF (DUF218 family)
VLLLLAALYLLRVPILVALGRFLTVEDALQRGDVIFVLAGDANFRPARAAELYHAGWAPRIVIPRPEDLPSHELGVMPNLTDLATTVMQRLGVPRDAIVVLTIPDGSTSTIDDARMFRAYAARHNVRRAIVVTSSFHTRRTRWVMRRALKGMGVELIMTPADDPRFAANNWWRSEPGTLAFVTEYLKWIHNATQW